MKQVATKSCCHSNTVGNVTSCKRVIVTQIFIQPVRNLPILTDTLNLVVTVRNSNFVVKNYILRLQNTCMCFERIWEQTAIISLYSTNWLVFVTETECVYDAVRGESLIIIQRESLSSILGPSIYLWWTKWKRTGFFPRTSAFPRQYRSINEPYSSLTWHRRKSGRILENLQVGNVL